MGKQATAYLEAKVGTASPAQLILILYDALIKSVIQAQEFIREARMEAAHGKLIKAQDIVAELAGSINLEAGPLAQNLLGLYQFMIEELIKANIKKDEKILEPVLDMVGHLRSAWLAGVIQEPEKS